MQQSLAAIKLKPSSIAIASALVGRPLGFAGSAGQRGALRCGAAGLGFGDLGHAARCRVCFLGG